MTKTIHPLRAWLRSATPDERETLAKAVGTSVGMLNQYAGSHRECSAERGGAIERETKRMSKASRGRLPVVYRTDIVSACRGCPYAQKCLGERAVISEFPIVDSRQVELPV